MPWKPNNAGQQMAQQAQQRAHRHNQQLARKQMQSLQDQWKARQAHVAAQMRARQLQEDAPAQRDNAPRSRGEGWSSDPPDSIGSEVPFRPPVPRPRSAAGGRSGVFVGKVRDIDGTSEQGGVNYQRWFHVAGAARAGRFAVLIGAIVFTASVTVLTSYVNNGTGSKSLLQATSGDLASPLYPKDFRILIGLAALVFVATILSLGMRRRPFMIAAAVASVGLIGYTLYIPQIGVAPGFGPYGSSYWLSLLAAVVMALGALVAATARSDY